MNTVRFGPNRIINLDRSYNIESRLQTYASHTPEEKALADRLNGAIHRYDSLLNRVGFQDQTLGDLDKRSGSVSLAAGTFRNQQYGALSLESAANPNGLPFNQLISKAEVKDSSGSRLFSYQSDGGSCETIEVAVDPQTRYRIQFAGPQAPVVVMPLE